MLAASSGGCQSTPQPTSPPPSTSTASASARSAPVVDWQPFAQATFDRARAEGKLVVVTVETNWCHWCHVMEDKVWPDAEVRRLLDAHYLAIRVNADAHPDVGERFSAWGWPATAILTPDGTQLVAVRGYKHPPKFRQLLALVPDAHRAGVLDDKLATLTWLSTTRKARMGRAAVGGDVDENPLLAQLDSFHDAQQGGWGRPQKYPLWAPVRASFLRDDDDDGTHLRRGRQAAAKYQLLQDPVAGGVFQYSTHGDWAHAHTEKLGIIQADMMQAFVDAHLVGDADALQAAQQVAGYVLSTLRSPTGAFYANQDADVRDGEDVALEGPKYYALDAAQRQAYPAPPVEPHVYASHNGRLIAALLRLSSVDGDTTLRDAADAALVDVERQLRSGAGFKHAVDQANGVLLLDDQVGMLQAYAARLSVAGDDDDLQKLKTLWAFVDARFHQDDGSYAARAGDDVGVLRGHAPVRSNARLATLLFALARLDAFDDDEKQQLRQRATGVLQVVLRPSVVENEGRGVADLWLAVAAQEERGLHISVVGASAADTAALRQAAVEHGGPGALVEHSPIGRRFSDMGKPAAFVCSSSSCSMPAFTADDLQTLLRRERGL